MASFRVWNPTENALKAAFPLDPESFKLLVMGPSIFLLESFCFLKIIWELFFYSFGKVFYVEEKYKQRIFKK